MRLYVDGQYMMDLDEWNTTLGGIGLVTSEDVPFYGPIGDILIQDPFGSVLALNPVILFDHWVWCDFYYCREIRMRVTTDDFLRF